jgi:DNA-binding CsgD family transcriptional regulator
MTTPMFNPYREASPGKISHDLALKLQTLSPRQREVAVLIAQGLSKPQVSGVLGVSTSTIKSHVHWILKHLGLKSRRELSLLLLHIAVIDRVMWTNNRELITCLTPQQLRVLAVVGPEPDTSHDEAGEVLGLSPHTIKYHVGRIYGALGVSSREELSSKYREMVNGSIGE